ncbi:MAG: hypothetical protein UU81_C0044G0017 [Microgenomates group bacterium GW2011_GWC1_41_8]|uniref:Uncharacterized protein n=3 Tax=Candidatus Roizmaniibacteriota TaxID=1752723 RepID=A0A0G0ZJ87_9BACT|nr:MAG: hypothetical protein UU14_C0008G0017 [Candidatus Roizmanbacteria bacterium GW2011_GWB1_40_7]KKR94273.1 MAG: hypothetical protein UU41_C0009G0019 [Candidatus Roizmanbacteria bacterium GW2011_GWA1_41_13]KKS22091.1 MAG: hypothetical protein UU78_C0023G0017 [Candidatus Roizmanbacteria bacterium GW2011_GWC2_41_7]KKS22981.1 MAG: hypothetical protein UU81_C0044G0017 [Microgenomates group bacterium GW2011_GWC1_41_8]
MNSAIVKGTLASLGLLIVYFTIISLVSGWSFAQDQFRQFWYYVVTLAIGFGVQVGLYSYLKSSIKSAVSPKVVATTGATSTAAMISCCAHYLVNVLPILGAVGIITVISQYQVQLFWVGLAFNFAGIAYMANKIYKFSKQI